MHARARTTHTIIYNAYMYVYVYVYKSRARARAHYSSGWIISYTSHGQKRMMMMMMMIVMTIAHTDTYTHAYTAPHMGARTIKEKELTRLHRDRCRWFRRTWCNNCRHCNWRCGPVSSPVGVFVGSWSASWSMWRVGVACICVVWRVGTARRETPLSIWNANPQC